MTNIELIEIRKLSGLTQQQFVDKYVKPPNMLGRTFSTYQKWEYGRLPILPYVENFFQNLKLTLGKEK